MVGGRGVNNEVAMIYFFKGSAVEKEGEGAEVGPEESEYFGEDGMPAVDNFRLVVLN